MKISNEELAKIVCEELIKLGVIDEAKWSPEMRSAAQSDAYRAAMTKKSHSGEAEKAAKEREFRKQHKKEKESGEGLPDWMTDEEEKVTMEMDGPQGYGKYLVDSEGNMTLQEVKGATKRVSASSKLDTIEKDGRQILVRKKARE